MKIISLSSLLTVSIGILVLVTYRHECFGMPQEEDAESPPPSLELQPLSPDLVTSVEEDDSENCPCIPRDECPRFYGQSALDVKELGFIRPCQEFGTVRCCGVTIRIVQNGDEEKEPAEEEEEEETEEEKVKPELEAERHNREKYESVVPSSSSASSLQEDLELGESTVNLSKILPSPSLPSAAALAPASSSRMSSLMMRTHGRKPINMGQSGPSSPLLSNKFSPATPASYGNDGGDDDDNKEKSKDDLSNNSTLVPPSYINNNNNVTETFGPASSSNRNSSSAASAVAAGGKGRVLSGGGVGSSQAYRAKRPSVLQLRGLSKEPTTTTKPKLLLKLPPASSFHSLSSSSSSSASSLNSKQSLMNTHNESPASPPKTLASSANLNLMGGMRRIVPPSSSSSSLQSNRKEINRQILNVTEVNVNSSITRSGGPSRMRHPISSGSNAAGNGNGNTYSSPLPAIRPFVVKSKQQQRKHHIHHDALLHNVEDPEGGTKMEPSTAATGLRQHFLNRPAYLRNRTTPLEQAQTQARPQPQPQPAKTNDQLVKTKVINSVPVHLSASSSSSSSNYQQQLQLRPPMRRLKRPFDKSVVQDSLLIVDPSSTTEKSKGDDDKKNNRFDNGGDAGVGGDSNESKFPNPSGPPLYRQPNGQMLGAHRRRIKSRIRPPPSSTPLPPNPVSTSPTHPTLATSMETFDGNNNNHYQDNFDKVAVAPNAAHAHANAADVITPSSPEAEAPAAAVKVTPPESITEQSAPPPADFFSQITTTRQSETGGGGIVPPIESYVLEGMGESDFAPSTYTNAAGGDSFFHKNPMGSYESFSSFSLPPPPPPLSSQQSQMHTPSSEPMQQPPSSFSSSSSSSSHSLSSGERPVKLYKNSQSRPRLSGVGSGETSSSPSSSSSSSSPSIVNSVPVKTISQYSRIRTTKTNGENNKKRTDVREQAQADLMNSTTTTNSSYHGGLSGGGNGGGSRRFTIPSHIFHPSGSEEGEGGSVGVNDNSNSENDKETHSPHLQDNMQGILRVRTREPQHQHQRQQQQHQHPQQRQKQQQQLQDEDNYDLILDKEKRKFMQIPSPPPSPQFYRHHQRTQPTNPPPPSSPPPASLYSSSTQTVRLSSTNPSDIKVNTPAKSSSFFSSLDMPMPQQQQQQHYRYPSDGTESSEPIITDVHEESRIHQTFVHQQDHKQQQQQYGNDGGDRYDDSHQQDDTGNPTSKGETGSTSQSQTSPSTSPVTPQDDSSSSRAPSQKEGGAQPIRKRLRLRVKSPTFTSTVATTTAIPEPSKEAYDNRDDFVTLIQFNSTHHNLGDQQQQQQQNGQVNEAYGSHSLYSRPRPTTTPSSPVSTFVFPAFKQHDAASKVTTTSTTTTMPPPPPSSSTSSNYYYPELNSSYNRGGTGGGLPAVKSSRPFSSRYQEEENTYGQNHFQAETHHSDDGNSEIGSSGWIVSSTVIENPDSNPNPPSPTSSSQQQQEVQQVKQQESVTPQRILSSTFSEKRKKIKNDNAGMTYNNNHGPARPSKVRFPGYGNERRKEGNLEEKVESGSLNRGGTTSSGFSSISSPPHVYPDEEEHSTEKSSVIFLSPPVSSSVVTTTTPSAAIGSFQTLSGQQQEEEEEEKEKEKMKGVSNLDHHSSQPQQQLQPYQSSRRRPSQKGSGGSGGRVKVNVESDNSPLASLRPNKRVRGNYTRFSVPKTFSHSSSPSTSSPSSSTNVEDNNKNSNSPYYASEVHHENPATNGPFHRENVDKESNGRFTTTKQQQQVSSLPRQPTTTGNRFVVSTGDREGEEEREGDGVRGENPGREHFGGNPLRVQQQQQKYQQHEHDDNPGTTTTTRLTNFNKGIPSTITTTTSTAGGSGVGGFSFVIESQQEGAGGIGGQDHGMIDSELPPSKSQQQQPYHTKTVAVQKDTLPPPMTTSSLSQSYQYNKQQQPQHHRLQPAEAVAAPPSSQYYGVHRPLHTTQPQPQHDNDHEQQQQYQKYYSPVPPPPPPSQLSGLKESENQKSQPLPSPLTGAFNGIPTSQLSQQQQQHQHGTPGFSISFSTLPEGIKLHETHPNQILLQSPPQITTGYFPSAPSQPAPAAATAATVTPPLSFGRSGQSYNIPQQPQSPPQKLVPHNIRSSDYIPQHDPTLPTAPPSSLNSNRYAPPPPSRMVSASSPTQQQVPYNSPPPQQQQQGYSSSPYYQQQASSSNVQSNRYLPPPGTLRQQAPPPPPSISPQNPSSFPSKSVAQQYAHPSFYQQQSAPVMQPAQNLKPYYNTPQVEFHAGRIQENNNLTPYPPPPRPPPRKQLYHSQKQQQNYLSIPENIVQDLKTSMRNSRATNLSDVPSIESNENVIEIANQQQLEKHVLSSVASSLLSDQNNNSNTMEKEDHILTAETSQQQGDGTQFIVNATLGGQGHGQGQEGDKVGKQAVDVKLVDLQSKTVDTAAASVLNNNNHSTEEEQKEDEKKTELQQQQPKQFVQEDSRHVAASNANIVIAELMDGESEQVRRSIGFKDPEVIQGGFIPILPYSEEDPGPILVKMQKRSSLDDTQHQQQQSRMTVHENTNTNNNNKIDVESTL